MLRIEVIRDLNKNNMKQLNGLWMVLMTGLFFLSSCATKCPDFDKTILDWMPYKQNDRIIISTGNKTDTLIVNMSLIEHTDKVGFGSKCSCQNIFSLQISSDSINIHGNFNDSRLVNESGFIINNWNFYYSEQKDTMEINGVNYSNLVIYANTENAYSPFEKLIISKSIGIIEIISKNGNWNLVDNSNRQIKISDINMQIHNCGM
jgi:hypothetical protein